MKLDKSMTREEFLKEIDQFYKKSLERLSTCTDALSLELEKRISESLLKMYMDCRQEGSKHFFHLSKLDPVARAYAHSAKKPVNKDNLLMLDHAINPLLKFFNSEQEKRYAQENIITYRNGDYEQIIKDLNMLKSEIKLWPDDLSDDYFDIAYIKMKRALSKQRICAIEAMIGVGLIEILEQMANNKKYPTTASPRKEIEKHQKYLR